MNRDYSYMLGNTFARGHAANATSFKTGMPPWNKGRKGLHLSPDSEFKPGPRPDKQYPVGAITVRKSKKGKLRQFVKTPDGWMEYAKALWTHRHGPLLDGDVVHHVNGDSLDDRLENLVAVPRSHHPAFHGRWGLKSMPVDVLESYRERYARRRPAIDAPLVAATADAAPHGHAGELFGGVG